MRDRYLERISDPSVLDAFDTEEILYMDDEDFEENYRRRVFNVGHNGGISLNHTGTPHEGNIPHSGRYPFGSGEDPLQHERYFIKESQKLRKQGLSRVEVAEAFGMSTDEWRRTESAYRALVENDNLRIINELRDEGYSKTKIAGILGVSEGYVRSHLKVDIHNENKKTTSAINTAKLLEEEVLKKRVIDIGKGVAQELGITEVTMKSAAQILKNDGYNIYNFGMPQVSNPKNKTPMVVLADKGISWADVVKNKSLIKSINSYSPDGGKSFKLWEYPESISSDRVKVVYPSEGGNLKDGVIELRRGVPDISLGNSNYAQVRIAVDGTHYLKGMAMYGDDKDFPPGVDILFNTSKPDGTPAMGSKDYTVLKKLKEDPDNPFGALLKANGQSKWTDEDGKEHLSVINKVKEEGDWDNYTDSIASQFLSKQPLKLVEKQLNKTYDDRVDEFKKIMSLTNPEVRRKELEDFAESCDSAATTLKAAALPRQTWKVLLPMTNLKENEVYAPEYKDGEELILVRYPHGGKFEIPKLIVNNSNPTNRKILPADSRDAIGINPKTAQILSGADFDGDTAIVIPNHQNGVHIENLVVPNSKLKDFDPHIAYPYVEGMKIMPEKRKGTEMGIISNLITDMTIKGAPYEEIERADMYSMVVIDAPKHRLNYKAAYRDFRINELVKTYQKHTDDEKYGGASTIISRAKSEVRIPERKIMRSGINPETGNKVVKGIDTGTGQIVYENTNRTYDKKEKNKDTGEYEVVKTGVEAQTKVAKALYYDDPMNLVSEYKMPVELLYADYMKKVKDLGNQARKESLQVVSNPRDPLAAEKYASEVASLKEKLRIAQTNSPKERMAHLKAHVVVQQKIEDNPDLKDDKEALEKERRRALAQARFEVGSGKKSVEVVFTDKEWEAVQNNAISPTQLRQILQNCNSDQVKQLSMPTKEAELSDITKSKIRVLASQTTSNGTSKYTISEIAEALGISTSSVKKYM